MTLYQRTPFSTLMILSLLAPATSFASAAFTDGFYIGAKIGAQQAMASWEQSDYATTYIDIDDGGSELDVTLVINNPDQEGQAFQTNLMGNVALGYARVRERLFLALEASVNVADAQEMDWRTHDSNAMYIETPDFTIDSEMVLDTHTEVELENPDMILDLRPGYLLAKNFLLYGRLGVALNELSIEQTATTVVAAEFDKIPTKGSSTTTDTVYGLRLGLGLEYKLTPQLGLNVDYVFTDYGDIDVVYADDYVVDGADGALTQNISSMSILTQTSANADVTKSALTMGFNWYFGG